MFARAASAYAIVLGALMASPFAPLGGALSPLDDDAGSGHDAPDSAADAMPIEPGMLAGRLTARVDEVDAYRIHLDAGQALVARLAGTSAQLSFPGGQPAARLATLASSPKDVVFEVVLTSATRVDYRVEVLRFDEPAQDDAASGHDAGDAAATASPLAAGTSSGRVDAYDTADVYRLPAGTWALRAPGMLLSMRSDEGKYLRSGKETLLVGADEPRFVALGALVPGNDAAQSVAYAIQVSAARLPVQLPFLAPPVATADGGFEMGAGGRLLHVTPEAVSISAAPSIVGKMAFRDGRGRAILQDPRLAQERGSEPTPITNGFWGPLAFGPDGRLYAAGASGGDVVAIDAARGVEKLGRAPFGASFGFAPDGTLWANGSVQGAREIPMRGPIVFDVAGRMYFAEAGALVRTAPGGSVAQETVAILPLPQGEIGAMVGSGTHLYLVTRDARVHVLDVDTEMFAGFRPDFDLAPLADLAVRIASVHVDTTQAVVSIEVSNVGAAASPPGGALFLSVWVPLDPKSSHTVLTLPAIQPGATATLSYPYDTTTSLPQRYEVDVRLDPYGSLVEDRWANDYDSTTFSPRPVSLA